VSEADAIDKAAAGFGLQENNSLSWFWENVPSEYGGLMRLYGGLMEFNGSYPLVNVYKTMENHHL
jgi:hypothetical protein